MPTYPIKCACGYAGDAVARVRDMDQDGKVPCPECGQHAEQDYSRKTINNTNTRFTLTRQRSWAEGYNPRTAREAQRLFGDRGGQCIDPLTGVVTFKDRHEQQMYERRKRELSEKADRRRKAKGLKTTADLSSE